ncbi:hypothetical protein JW935_19355 [candidate division KSB1 bacterium]|nr:hypothetical protein [candidate division KSB1 bacterium]
MRYMVWLLILGLVGGAMADDGDGGYAGAFLRMGMGARAKSMGDALTAVPQDATAGFYNPALLPHLTERQVLLSFGFLPLDRSVDYVGYAQSLQPKVDDADGEQPLRAGFSVAWIHAGVDKIDGRDSAGNHIGDFSNSEHAFCLSFALSPASFLSFGLGGKVLYNRFPKIAQEDAAITSTGFGLDFGAYVTPVKDVMIGFVVRDNMSKYTWNTDKLWERGTSTTYKFPRVIRTGLAYRIPQQWLLIAADYEDSKEQHRRLHLGAEFSYPEIGALRIGLDDDMPTFGIGFQTNLLGKKTTVNYAFIASAKDGPGSDHYFTWTFSF